jgi:hypothetical protein
MTDDRAAISEWLKSTKRSPLSILGDAITRAAYTCAGVMESDVNHASDSEKQTKQIVMFWEYFCFFMHMGGRAIQNVLRDVTKSHVLCQRLASEFVPLAVKSMFPQATPSLRETLERDLWAMLEQAEDEYSECKQLYIKDDFLTDEGLFNKLGKRVADACGYPTNIFIYMKAASAAIDCWMKIEMEQLVLY